MTILDLKQVCIFINSILPLKISDIAIKIVWGLQMHTYKGRFVYELA